MMKMKPYLNSVVSSRPQEVWTRRTLTCLVRLLRLSSLFFFVYVGGLVSIFEKQEFHFWSDILCWMSAYRRFL
jgi:hypothetical protein